MNNNQPGGAVKAASQKQVPRKGGHRSFNSAAKHQAQSPMTIPPHLQTDKSPVLLCVEGWETDSKIVLGGPDKTTNIVDELFYRWDTKEGYWQQLDDNAMEAEALSWFRLHLPKCYGAKMAAAAVSSARLEFRKNTAKHLPRAGQAAIVPVRKAYLIIQKTAEGGVEILAEAPDPRFGIRHSIRADFDWSLVDEDGHYTPAPLNPNSEFAKFLGKIMPDMAVRDRLQEALASSLLPMTFEKSIWLQGIGSNGKSTMISILTAFHRKTLAVDLETLDKDFSLEDLVGATLVTVGETPQKPINDSRLKSLVSRDLVSINRKNKPVLTIRPTATWLLAMNKTPPIRDHTHGFWRKIEGIPFSQTLPTEGSTQEWYRCITENPVEMAEVLNWLLVGAMRLVARGHFATDDPQAMKELRDQQMSDTNSAHAYIREFDLTVTDGVWTSKQAIYDHYREFCEDNGRSVQSAASFWVNVKENLRREGGRVIHEKKCRVTTPKGSQRVIVVMLEVEDVKSFERTLPPLTPSASVTPITAAKPASEATTPSSNAGDEAIEKLFEGLNF